jgi:ATP-dependent DNA helicase RecG
MTPTPTPKTNSPGYYVQSTVLVGRSSDSHHPTSDTHQPAPNTHQSAPNTHQPATDTHQLLKALPAGLRARIPGPGTKPRKETLRALIRDLCAWRALRARDIAELLGGRDHKHLVREFLSPMVHAGVLTYTIPAMEKHPDQRYTLPANGGAEGRTKS